MSGRCNLFEKIEVSIVPKVCPLITITEHCIKMEGTKNGLPDPYPCLAFEGGHGFTDPKDYMNCWVFSRWFWDKVTEK